MKKVLLGLILVSSFSVFGNDIARFSAFSDGESLHITVVGVRCNPTRIKLEVAENCKNSRLSRNLALTCSVKLIGSSTVRGCREKIIEPQVTSISLEDSNIAAEAEELTLTYNGSSITIDLDGQLDR